jgi:hypothetical protein
VIKNAYLFLKWHERTKEEHCGIYMREQKVLDGLRLEMNAES